MNYDGSWHGGKGSRPRKTDMDKLDEGWNRIFKTFSPLQRKKIVEAWYVI